MRVELSGELHLCRILKNFEETTTTTTNPDLYMKEFTKILNKKVVKLSISNVNSVMITYRFIWFSHYTYIQSIYYKTT